MLTTIRNITCTLTDPLLDFIFPPSCLNCQQLLSDGEQYVCKDCWNSIERIHLEHPLYVDTREKLVSAGFVSDLVSCFVFETEGTFQRLAHVMKYEGFESLGVRLGKELGAALQEQKIRADYLLPIPLHRRKYRERGSNQAELIARGVSEMTGIPLRADLLQRSRYTETQTTLKLDQRQKNMEDAFGVVRDKEAEVRGRVFIIVDDVITTGATINSCAEELIAAGASKVIAASLALAQ